ncbi:hypothetical protein AB0467_28520 [Streptomyces sp. NPDC052095]
MRRPPETRRRTQAAQDQETKDNPILADLIWLQQTRSRRLAETSRTK